MNRRVILQALGLWLLMAVLAIANGTLRQAALAAGNLWPIIPVLMLLGMPLMKAKETTA